MSFIKRISLFLIVNFFIVLTISTILRLFQVGPFLQSTGLNYRSLALFCFLWGMIGSVISLLLSKKMAVWIMKVRIIHPSSFTHKPLFDMVETLAKKASLPMPEVGIYPGKEVNAFATGPSKKHALVALSQGMIDTMPMEEIEAVVAHELSHIKNGDMVTMTLLQGVINAFVLFLARIAAYGVSGIGKNEKRGSYMSYYLLVYAFEICFMMIGSIVVSAFSRFREYRADYGAAKLSTKEKMISALESLASLQKKTSSQKSSIARQEGKAAFNALKISSSKGGVLQLFASHPPLQERIARLKAL